MPIGIDQHGYGARILPGQIAMLIPDRLLPFIWLIRQIRFKARQPGIQIRLDRQKSEFRNLPAYTLQVELHQMRPGIENGTSSFQKRCQTLSWKLRETSSKSRGTVRSDW